MKVWHKILVAPGVAIVFLIMLGAISYSVLTHQHSTLAELFNTRFGDYQLAAGHRICATDVARHDLRRIDGDGDTGRAVEDFNLGRGL